jgi:hypothetical protein
VCVCQLLYRSTLFAMGSQGECLSLSCWIACPNHQGSAVPSIEKVERGSANYPDTDHCQLYMQGRTAWLVPRRRDVPNEHSKLGTIQSNMLHGQSYAIQAKLAAAHQATSNSTSTDSKQDDLWIHFLFYCLLSENLWF